MKRSNDWRDAVPGVRKLSERSLSNLTPQPLHSFFRYSHPALVERIEAMRGRSARRSALIAVGTACPDVAIAKSEARPSKETIE